MPALATFVTLIFLSTLADLPAESGKSTPDKPSGSDGDATAAPAGQAEKLIAAAKIGRSWLDHVKAGTMAEGIKLWGYSAFQGTTPEVLRDRLDDQSALLGRLLYCELLEDRCLIDMDGTAPKDSPGEIEGASPGVYVTLRYFSEYEKGVRLESLILHEPKKDPAGLKITGLRRESLPTGPAGAVGLAADLGQLALLKLRGAPPERWEPYFRQATALAASLKITLPAIPDAVGSDDPKTGEKLVSFIMETAPPLFEKLGSEGGAGACRAVLNAFAVLMLYSAGDETVTRLAVLAGTEAEKAKLPPELWKPLIRAVSGKEKFPVVLDVVQRMVAVIPDYLAAKKTVADLKAAPREILAAALANMAKLPTYTVRGELTAADGRRCVMDAALAPGAMDLTLQGFDGSRERRLVNDSGFRISRDEGRTWADDPDHEIAVGLCRTLQHPLDLSRKYTERHTFTFAGEEKIDDEQLFRFESSDVGGEPAPTYWVLMSRSGPVIRRARVPMKFGEVKTDALLIYRRLGKEVEIANPEAVPEQGEK